MTVGELEELLAYLHLKAKEEEKEMKKVQAKSGRIKRR